MGLSLGSIGSLAGAYFGGTPVAAIAGGLLGSAIDGNPSIVGGGGSSGSSGTVSLPVQDRSGFSSGSANYSPEYYAALQSKYNQYMPQQQGKDITTDLKNWYDTKYTPQANVAANPTLTTTGTGYSTPSTLTNLGIKPQTVAPSYTALTPSKSTETDVASEYAKYIAAAGGNTQANRDAAIQYLQQKGFSGSQIDAAYNKYLSTLPASTGTTAQTMAANSTPAQIAQAYAGFVNANGGDTQANQAKAIQYLQQLGVPYATIEAAYPIYKSSSTVAAAAPSTPTTTTTGGGMLTGGSATSAPSYTSLSSASSPAAIAAAYRDFVSGAGGDTQANQQAAIDYLTNLGVSNDTIGQAYGLFKG